MGSNRRHVTWRGAALRKARRRAMARLTLTSMVDIFTTLLLFLLKSFVVEPQVVTPHPDVVLPLSASADSPEESPVVVVGTHGVVINDERVADVDGMSGTDNAATSRRGNPGQRTIEPLRSRLAEIRARSADLRTRRGAPAEGPYRLTIQGDREIPFATLERVLYTAHMAGYAQISLATRSE
jgi:biopolymer transport protein ExbD